RSPARPLTSMAASSLSRFDRARLIDTSVLTRASDGGDGTPPRAPPPPIPRTQVGSFPTRSDAELAQSALAAAGIQSEVASDDAGGAYPFDFAGGARLLVAEADAED